jgi:hypothetical protein
MGPIRAALCEMRSGGFCQPLRWLKLPRDHQWRRDDLQNAKHRAEAMLWQADSCVYACGVGDGGYPLSSRFFTGHRLRCPVNSPPRRLLHFGLRKPRSMQ